MTQLLCVRVCEATGDAELKSIFLPPPSPLFFLPLLPPSLSTSRLHLSLYVNHRSLSEASSQATFKHIEPCTSPLPFPPPALNLPALNLSPHTLSSFTLSRRFTLLPNFSPHTVAPPPSTSPSAFPVPLSALCVTVDGVISQTVGMTEQVFSKWAFERSPHHHRSTRGGLGICVCVCVCTSAWPLRALFASG